MSDERVEVTGSSDVQLEISDELKKRLEQCARSGRGFHNAYPWTPEQDAALLAYWPVKNHEQVARALGVSTNTALKRYRELTNGE